jgi:hypothetical protein
MSLGTGLKCVVSFTPLSLYYRERSPQYLLQRNTVGPHVWSRCLMEYWADYLIPGPIFFQGNYNTQRSGNRVGQVSTLFKCMYKTGGRYLPAFGLWKPFSERLSACASHLTREEKVQQRVCIDFSFRVGKTGAETYEMLHAAFGESCLSRSKTFEWYSRFKSGGRSFEDDPRPGRPSTSHTDETVALLREIIRADRRLTIREVAEDVRIEFGTCQKILTEDLQMRRV